MAEGVVRKLRSRLRQKAEAQRTFNSADGLSLSRPLTTCAPAG